MVPACSLEFAESEILEFIPGMVECGQTKEARNQELLALLSSLTNSFAGCVASWGCGNNRDALKNPAGICDRV